MVKVTLAEYTVFCEKYYGKQRKEYPHYRFGQAFWNEFCISHKLIEVDNLFYVTDEEKAQKIIYENYLLDEGYEYED